jgi:hypothetical protein
MLKVYVFLGVLLAVPVWAGLDPDERVLLSPAQTAALASLDEQIFHEQNGAGEFRCCRDPITPENVICYQDFDPRYLLSPPPLVRDLGGQVLAVPVELRLPAENEVFEKYFVDCRKKVELFPEGLLGRRVAHEDGTFREDSTFPSHVFIDPRERSESGPLRFYEEEIRRKREDYADKIQQYRIERQKAISELNRVLAESAAIEIWFLRIDEMVSLMRFELNLERQFCCRDRLAQWMKAYDDRKQKLPLLNRAALSDHGKVRYDQLFGDYFDANLGLVSACDALLASL